MSSGGSRFSWVRSNNGLAGFSTTVGFVHGWGDNSLKMFDPDTNQDVRDPDIRVLAGC
jgi:hypothetical protein